MHEAFTWMRANEPLYRCEQSGMWGITRHADVLDVEHRSDVFSSAGSYRSFQNPDEDNMIAQDDPGHIDQRRLVSRRFTPKAVKGIESVMTRMIDSRWGTARQTRSFGCSRGMPSSPDDCTSGRKEPTDIAPGSHPMNGATWPRPAAGFHSGSMGGARSRSSEARTTPMMFGMFSETR